MGTLAPNAVPLTTVLSDTVAAARTAGRDDLVGRLEKVAGRVRDPRHRIVVTGQRGQGKSRFVNALLGLDICEVGDDTTTVLPLQLSYGAQPRAHLVLADRGADESRVEIPLADIGVVDHRSPLAAGKQVVRIEAELPNQLLADGVVLIDTPGVGGHGSTCTAGILGVAAAADAVLVLSDASTELTEPELTFVRQIREMCPTVAVLLTKTDLYPHWHQVLEADRAHLTRADIDVTLIPVSALLRAHAVRLQDAQLGLESGFGALFGFLRDRVVTRDHAVTRVAVARELSSAAEHLALALGSELVALRDPALGSAAVNELQSARTAAADLQRRTASWQQTLADGITDLVGDIDHDLRERLRGTARTGQEWIDEHDPGRHWGAIAEWLTGTVDTALGENLLLTHRRAELLAERIADHFAEIGAVDLPEVHTGMDDERTLVGSGSLAELEPDIGFTSKVLVGMRGSYGGVLMVGLATTFAGLAMLNPISLGAGLIVGGKAYRDDKSARLARRRIEANAEVRRFLDDVAFQAGKDTKDRLHRIHRALRDHFAGVAERSLRSIDDSLRAAQEAATMAATQRAERVIVLERQLNAVAELRRYADSMHTEQGRTGGTVSG
ncbi:Isoniazid-inducible protein iniA [Nocardia mangyaensis]|uniref:Isoniazid-inducible protein iniA n=1 Tax=Nocardia mangyaensis TaxID=2213200 RepID=A0A1J0W028_9NOCA|nr:dynamin family protein [Nocardia mangyaensis]APE37621.1 Isoniazid-inducible protein iniA [Nocardia mangyaensis]